MTTTSGGPELPAGSTTPSRLAAYREQAEVMREALEELPEEYRDIVRLRLFEHCALEEIAVRLGIGASAVRHRFRKGSELYLGRLRAALGSQSRPPISRSVPDSAAKRKFSLNQITLSCRLDGVTGGAGRMRSVAMPVSAPSRATHASLNAGSALSSANTAPDSTADS